MEKIINEIMTKKIGDVDVEVSLAKYTTYRVGGIAKILVHPKNVDKLVELMEIINREKIKYFVLGNGSNVLFSDKTYEGIIIKLDNFDNLEIEDNIITVGAGYNLVKLSNEVAKLGLAGLEFASGIPGTLGGAVFMNAGAYNSEMKNVVKSVKVLTPDLKIINLSNSEMEFDYRKSFMQNNKGYICIEATLKLIHGDKDLLMDIIKDRKLKRRRTQPLEYPTAGSVFRNPDSMFAGKLIEDLGLKDFQIGGAKISPKHANFIINTGNATASDIKEIIDIIKEKVYDKYKIKLRVEQRLVNWDD